MLTKTINSSWQMRRVNDPQWLPAAVPGSVYGDLLAAGKMEDPFYRANEEDALKLMEYDYEYRTSFDAEASMLQCEENILQFRGLDTLADIYLNDTLIGSADNMHRVALSLERFGEKLGLKGSPWKPVGRGRLDEWSTRLGKPEA